MARAIQLVADELSLTCETVTNPSKTWVWNRVLVDDAWLHVDVAAALEQQRQENANDAAAEPADSITQYWLLVDEDELEVRLDQIKAACNEHIEHGYSMQVGRYSKYRPTLHDYRSA